MIGIHYPTILDLSQPPRRGRPPNAAEALPPTPTPPAASTHLPRRAQRRQVSFRCPLITTDLPSATQQQLYPSGRPARSAGPPMRYPQSASSTTGGLGFGGSCSKTADPSLRHLYIALCVFLFVVFAIICLRKKCKNKSCIL
jgi:hypothetical protein